MLVHDHKTKKSEVIDFMETATSAADPDFFKGDRTLLEKVSSEQIFVHLIFSETQKSVSVLSWKQIKKRTDIKF